MEQKLTQRQLKKIVHYDPHTGIFTDKNTGRAGIKKGSKLGQGNRYGYKSIVINRKRYSLSRLAWLYMEGYLPEHYIDHKNGIKDDNKWENLRHVTSVCNSQNKGNNRRNKSGFNGVSFDKRNNKWVAHIAIKFKLIHIGRYDDPLEAALARYTVETQCPFWTCNHRSELVKAIRREWPEFIVNLPSHIVVKVDE